MQVEFSSAHAALLRFNFEREQTSNGITVACPRLAGPAEPESWRDEHGDLIAVCIEVPEHNGDVEAAAFAAYQALLAQVRSSEYPYMVRIWNYLDDINEGHADDERYRRFCLGRAAAVDASFNDPPPAATAIGHAHSIGRVQVIALCSRGPALALENPRQMPAWRYPRDYGPVSPGFSRGALIGHGPSARLLASGTASIVGHHSLHPGDVGAQLREALANLAGLLDEGEAVSDLRFSHTEPEAMRLYLRAPEDLAVVQAEMTRAGIAADTVVYLHGDVCRRELLVELEAVFAPR